MTDLDRLRVPQVVERADGTLYRARKPPEAVEVRMCGYGPGILVLRCHDVDVANVLAFEAFLLDADLASTTKVEAFEAFLRGHDAEPIWVRWVLDDYDDPEAGGGWERELRGTPGSTPAVLFANPNPATRGHTP